jgi:hypothetical protein
MGRTVPLWDGSDRKYTYEMVGTNPFVPEGRRAHTIVKAEVFPVVVTFADTGAVFDPTITDAVCSPAGSAMELTMASPVFQPTTITPGGTSLGTGEYPSYLFQRANFYSETAGSDAINPNYGVTLQAVEEPSIDIVVAPDSGETVELGCDQLGLLNVIDFDRYLQSAIQSSSLRHIITPTALPIFVLSNVVGYLNAPNDCCVLGYHAAMRNSAHNDGFQTYAVADFDTSGLFAGSSDITDLSHEVAEWMDDPAGTNPTPPWGKIGQVTGCQANLEVGDPLTGTDFPMTMPNGYTYHPQELAFKSWFYRDKPSSGVNGWYSFNGTFKSPSAPCS